MENKNRLFVNLVTDSFLDFAERGKRYEIRNCRNAFSEKQVYLGRRVELRKAWKRGSLWGTINKVVAGTLEEIFDAIDYQLIEPRVADRNEAIDENRKILKGAEKYVAFEIVLDSVQSYTANK